MVILFSDSEVVYIPYIATGFSTIQIIIILLFMAMAILFFSLYVSTRKKFLMATAEDPKLVLHEIYAREQMKKMEGVHGVVAEVSKPKKIPFIKLPFNFSFLSKKPSVTAAPQIITGAKATPQQTFTPPQIEPQAEKPVQNSVINTDSNTPGNKTIISDETIMQLESMLNDVKPGIDKGKESARNVTGDNTGSEAKQTEKQNVPAKEVIPVITDKKEEPPHDITADQQKGELSVNRDVENIAKPDGKTADDLQLRADEKISVAEIIQQKDKVPAEIKNMNPVARESTEPVTASADGKTVTDKTVIINDSHAIESDGSSNPQTETPSDDNASKEEQNKDWVNDIEKELNETAGKTDLQSGEPDKDIFITDLEKKINELPVDKDNDKDKLPEGEVRAPDKEELKTANLSTIDSGNKTIDNIEDRSDLKEVSIPYDTKQKNIKKKILHRDISLNMPPHGYSGKDETDRSAYNENKVKSSGAGGETDTGEIKDIGKDAGIHHDAETGEIITDKNIKVNDKKTTVSMNKTVKSEKKDDAAQNPDKVVIQNLVTRYKNGKKENEDTESLLKEDNTSGSKTEESSGEADDQKKNDIKNNSKKRKRA